LITRRRVGSSLKPPLGRELRLHVAVEVEVIAREVGEHAGGESQRVDAAQRERATRPP
jgi:hypothetical protein